MTLASPPANWPAIWPGLGHIILRDAPCREQDQMVCRNPRPLMFEPGRRRESAVDERRSRRAPPLTSQRCDLCAAVIQERRCWCRRRPVPCRMVRGASSASSAAGDGRPRDTTTSCASTGRSPTISDLLSPSEIVLKPHPSEARVIVRCVSSSARTGAAVTWQRRRRCQAGAATPLRSSGGRRSQPSGRARRGKGRHQRKILAWATELGRERSWAGRAARQHRDRIRAACWW